MEKSKEEIEFENEMRIREMLKIWFNETAEDFETMEEYNRYLELVEDVGCVISRDEGVRKGRSRDRQQAPRLPFCQERTEKAEAAERDHKGPPGQL